MPIAIPMISHHSMTLVDVLQDIAPGETCSYAALTTSIGRNVQSEARSCLATARRLLQREQQMVFASVRGVGLKRLTDGEITTIGPQTLQKINRASRRGIHKLTCVQRFADLTNDEKIRHNTALSILGVFHEVSKTKSVKQIEVAVTGLQKQLPLKEALQAFIVSA